MSKKEKEESGPESAKGSPQPSLCRSTCPDLCPPSVTDTQPSQHHHTPLEDNMTFSATPPYNTHSTASQRASGHSVICTSSLAGQHRGDPTRVTHPLKCHAQTHTEVPHGPSVTTHTQPWTLCQDGLSVGRPAPWDTTRTWRDSHGFHSHADAGRRRRALTHFRNFPSGSNPTPPRSEKHPTSSLYTPASC